MSPKPIDAWGFWHKSQEALDELNALMQLAATYVAHAELPHHVAKDIKRNLGRFQENFNLMVREQKRKAGR